MSRIEDAAEGGMSVRALENYDSGEARQHKRSEGKSKRETSDGCTAGTRAHLSHRNDFLPFPLFDRPVAGSPLLSARAHLNANGRGGGGWGAASGGLTEEETGWLSMALLWLV